MAETAVLFCSVGLIVYGTILQIDGFLDLSSRNFWKGIPKSFLGGFFITIGAVTGHVFLQKVVFLINL